MGKKKDALKQELELARSAAAGAMRTHEQLLAENEALRAQLDGTAPLRLVTDQPPTPIRGQIARALGIDPKSYQGGVTDEMILDAVERLRNPQLGDSYADIKDALVMTKGDSLAEAIQHNKSQRQELEAGVSAARGIVNRVAAALSVSQWNPDGDEIVEKAQRFGVFWHWLRKRLRDVEATRPNAGGFDDERRVADALINELHTILAALVGDKELARILQNKPAKVSKTVLDLAENPAPNGITYLDKPFTGDDVMWIRDALKKVHTGADPHRLGQLLLVFERLATSAAAIDELCSWINAVVLPTLRKQHRAYAGAPKEN